MTFFPGNVVLLPHCCIFLAQNMIFSQGTFTALRFDGIFQLVYSFLGNHLAKEVEGYADFFARTPVWKPVANYFSQ